jgi:hypothetical protein
MITGQHHRRERERQAVATTGRVHVIPSPEARHGA